MKPVGGGVLERLGHIGAGHDAHALATHGFGKTAGGNISPSEDNLRTRVEQRGTDSEGVDFAQRARGEDRRMVANTVVVGHAGGKGAQ